MFEAQIFRQMTTAQGLDNAFARHVVDDIVLPLLAGAAAQGGQHAAQDKQEEE